MIAGGLGNIRPMHLAKKDIPDGSKIIVIGGPAMLIGLGGGAASSMASGSSHESLDFASVQRGNPEMERRCQEVIDHCNAMGEATPILSIHDIGAGGLSNAVPEIINDAGRGGIFELRNIPNDEKSMSPMEIWCNESQERYVVAVAEKDVDYFVSVCQRERCIYAVLGTATDERTIKLNDELLGKAAINLPLDVLFGKPPKMRRDVKHIDRTTANFDTSKLDLSKSIQRVLSLPSVANKSFLITIGDRSITGMVHRDQMVGPWQVPVADVAVTLRDLFGNAGEAMAIGEKPLSAIANPEASGRMAVCEALTNLIATDVSLSDICLSANWMAAAGVEGEDAALFDTVKAVAEKICPELGIAIPVGKDSMSMRTVWDDNEMIGPLSLVITAFAKVADVRKTLTPQLRTDKGETTLLLIDLGNGKNRLGGSALAQVYNQIASQTPDCEDASQIKALYQFMTENRNKILAYHDRADGGLFTTLVEMAFAGHTGLDIDITSNTFEYLFNEELGAVIQVATSNIDSIMACAKTSGLDGIISSVARLNSNLNINIKKGSDTVFSQDLSEMQKVWSKTSYEMQKLRDNPECAEQEFALISNENQGIVTNLTYDPSKRVAINTGAKPKMAILREQGVNGQIEMAAAFERAGFDVVDVHMSDLIDKGLSLSEFKGLVACGGFSYGDVLGAGGGWAKTILNHSQVRDNFEAFFNTEDSFSLGVCNGCQMLSQLHELIPGTEFWPTFEPNLSEQFEGRFSTVKISKTPSILLDGMEGSTFPIAVAHGEGRALFTADNQANAQAYSAMHYVDSAGNNTETYPLNPNGSPDGLAGLCSKDGRVTIMMPHPERVYRTVQNSWHPDNWGDDAPTMKIFDNARNWVK
jgi:phosphoribosylformylglycinamidine synthase